MTRCAIFGSHERYLIRACWRARLTHIFYFLFLMDTKQLVLVPEADLLELSPHPATNNPRANERRERFFMRLSIARRQMTPSLTESSRGTSCSPRRMRLAAPGTGALRGTQAAWRDLSIAPRKKVKEPGKNPMPGLKMTFPN